MFLFGLILGLLAGICIAFVWNEFFPNTFDKTASKIAQELKEIEDELRGKD